ncbi:hypothetical protein ACJRO7_018486 [Eucalyptus globulus]|uniref:GIL1/IRKI C-terminal domain-containing protein n=1 Tax=Eucalyptus globulus TaxID=34317 RepID=A0ABD3KUV8_EUCGL
MPPSKPSSSPSSSSKSPPSPPLCFPLQSPHFTPIQECQREEEEEDANGVKEPTPRARATPATPKHHHQPTPLHHAHRSGKPPSKKRQDPSGGDDMSVSCNNCRPHARERISVVPLDHRGHHHGLGRHSIPSPNGIFKSILSTLTKRSPRSIDAASSAASSVREEQWKIALAELSHKLIQTTRKRDEAILEASRVNYSMAELEKKLNKLELYCHSLKSGLDECSNSPYRASRSTRPVNPIPTSNDKVVEPFLVAVSEARSSVRLLSRSLAMQLRGTGGGKLHERVSLLLQPHDVKAASPPSRSPRSLLVHLEALLNRAFFEDFESVGFQKSAPSTILNPVARCEANLTSFNVLCRLTWDEVLNKGTRHFSEEFSRFCDRKMSEIVAMLGWTKAWPEPLLQAFFGASKGVWLVHLLANSVHPGLPIYRVDMGTRFDPVYMDDMGADKARDRLVPTEVRIMVTPGFYVYRHVVKCKVLCRYYSSGSPNGMVIDDKDSVSATSP